ncbi:hypothetical protein CLU95_4346 [Variovorax sp. 54]|uniref:hypothetical protein n=1 Tax=Variovorax sp. 54 TaxID=2035212 RepID=UPI000C18A2DF|nr:hypothetical protein [Variovorax sp. 54]PIF77173.1 hypothetical protein CLU95_4346 [Variovorax sp. 54]
MTHIFTLHRESLKRRFAVYVVVAHSQDDARLYVGKTGDNRMGCNPLISRCGNHFSYNDIHSQIRNGLSDHEERDYTYVFDHFDDYTDDELLRRTRIDRINEMERWLNQQIQVMLQRFDCANLALLNTYQGVGHVPQAKRDSRAAFRTTDAQQKIDAIVEAVRNHCAQLPCVAAEARTS